ncbi:MAG: cation diffusion facilitator family transporter [Gammaproteobacteria bacterium]|nr:MAG: cation diffusion facilitator family transporter [Gammaproteobacteria bacterium]
MTQGADSLRSILYALAANVAIAAAKLGGAFYTGSSAMLAEAIHSLADSGNQLLLLWGLRQSRRPPTPEHPLGHGKAIYFWSFIVALMLFSMGGLFSIYEGVHRLQGAEGLHDPWVAVAILAFGIAAEGLSLAGCLKEVAKLRRGRSLWRWFRETRHSELIVVVGEDLAALTGLSFALLAVLLAIRTGDPSYDAAGSIAIGVLLILVALAVAAEVHSLLLGESADPALERAIRRELEACEEVEEVLGLITQQLGSEVMVAVKARMRRQADDLALIEAINRCERRLRSALPEVRWVFFEPDLRD